MIGVGGCVASQEGEAIVKRAPYVDLVFGPQTLHRLPDMLKQRRSSGRAQIDISFPEIEKFDHMPPAKVEGASPEGRCVGKESVRQCRSWWWTYTSKNKKKPSKNNEITIIRNT